MLISSEVKDPYWNLSQNPTTMICHSDGDHDLAHTVLEVGFEFHWDFLVAFYFWIFQCVRAFELKCTKIGT